jgi:hypothetical protein
MAKSSVKKPPSGSAVRARADEIGRIHLSETGD